VGQVVVVTLGGLRVIAGDLTIGTFVAFYLYLEMLLPPMMDLPNLFVTARQAFVCMDRLDELDAHDRAGEGAPFLGSASPATPATLSARGVTFRYSADLPPAVQDVDLDVAPGEKVALVGPIGAGKSTLARILAGHLTADQGTVTFGGFSYHELDPARFRQRVGLVTQDPILFSTTVRENITCERPGDDRWLDRVLGITGMDDEVAALPDGLETMLGQRGLGLSGGQRHRLAIARALYGRPDLLILDDITAALDAENEEALWRAILRELPGIAALVVTHRAATASRMDRTIVLEEGRVVAMGTHEDLLQRSAYYRTFRLRATAAGRD
jgi:ATP-binding cassette subfamily B protein